MTLGMIEWGSTGEESTRLYVCIVYDRESNRDIQLFIATNGLAKNRAPSRDDDIR